jgi:nucleoid-associated protein YgaU
MRDFLKKIRFALDEQNISMALGVLVVLLVGSLLFNYFKSVNSTPGDTTSTNTEVAATTLPTMEELPKDYQVQKGDSLWNISEKVYGSGYNWTDVHNANKETIANPNVLVEGTKITLPKAESKMVAQETQTEVKTVEYTVAKGDNLWKIAVGTCNNGYLWPTIARENSLRNANHLEVGQKLNIVCK